MMPTFLSIHTMAVCCHPPLWMLSNPEYRKQLDAMMEQQVLFHIMAVCCHPPLWMLSNPEHRKQLEAMMGQQAHITFLDDDNTLRPSPGSSCVHDRAADAHRPPCCRVCVLLHVSAAALRLLLRRHSSRRQPTASARSSCVHARAEELVRLLDVMRRQLACCGSLRSTAALRCGV